MNERGITLVETILTVMILFAISGTLIPFSYQLYSTVYNKKVDLHASETALQAAKIILNDGIHTGVHKIENTNYLWDFDGFEICVHYKNLDGVRVKCISQYGEND